MSIKVPRTGMALAAGLGMRMRPLTLERPKPLIEVGGKTLLDHTLDHMAEAGVETAIVNTFYKGEMIATHVADRISPRVVLSPEETLLETGGGVKRALPLLGSEPFFVANADILFFSGSSPALVRMAEVWDPSRMDALLLLIAVKRAFGLEGRGDYHMDGNGQLTRRGKDEASSDWFYAGVQIVNPAAFTDTPDGAFSNNLVWDRAQAAGRLFGLAHDGAWYHVGDPVSLAKLHAILAKPVQDAP